jgi:hypothetical protein
MSLLRGGFSGAVLLFAFAAGACSGESTANDDGGDDEDTGGSAGESSGGSANGGSGQGGASGGTGGTAGSATGGAGTGGSGTGGTGAMRGYHPPDRHVQGCQTLCELNQTAMCPNENMQDCLNGCRVGILFEPCAALWDPVFECVSTTTNVQCDDDGEATLPDCVTPYIEVLACVLTDGMNDDLDAACTANCMAETAAACPNGGTQADCEGDCGIIASAFPVCAGPLETFLTCSAGSSHSCDADGEPVPDDCDSPYLLFLNCVVTEYDYEI